MKKLIALLLAAVMCLSLVACGGGETPSIDNNSTQEQQTQNDNNEPESTGTEIAEPENTEPQYEIVEITLDNWQEYFELREYYEFKENAFGEFDRANTKYTLVIKDGIDIEASESNVVIEYIRTVDYKPYKVDFENKTITHGETIRTETNTDNPTIVEMKTQLYDKYGATLFQSNYNRLEGNSERVFVDFELLRIKGSIYILH